MPSISIASPVIFSTRCSVTTRNLNLFYWGFMTSSNPSNQEAHDKSAGAAKMHRSSMLHNGSVYIRVARKSHRTSCLKFATSPVENTANVWKKV